MELTFKLKQHTPLIHFQWEQEGATLRASEIKPKLDKYVQQLDRYYSVDIINKLKGIPDGNGIYSLKVLSSPLKERIIPKILDKNTRFDEAKNQKYKKIEDISNPDYKQKMKRSLYFGNVEAMLEYKDEVSLKILSFDQKILAKAFLALPIMLAFENFGSRQNKGFGSFYIDRSPIFKLNESIEIEGLHDIEEIYIKYSRNSQNNVYVFNTEAKDHIEVFRKIFYFYNALKAGINEGNSYSKSLLWKYMRNNNPDLIWEKRIMKMILANYTLPNPLSAEYQYIRVLLGLSPTYEFKSTIHKVNDAKIDNPARMDIDYSDTGTLSINGKKCFITEDYPGEPNDKIERSNSPIIFKPVKIFDSYKVYIILKKELIQKIMGRDFCFREKSSGNTFYIKSPTIFDLNIFMNFAINEMNSNKVNHFVNGLKIKQLIYRGGIDGK